MGEPAVDYSDGICPLSTDQIIDKILVFTQALSDVKFYAYQAIFAYRIVESVLTKDQATITGLWARQCGKCLARDTLVMMFDGTIKKVQYIKEGDLLMGDDSTPRRVLSIARGRETMVRVVPLNGAHEPYVVNRSHILSVKRKRRGSSAQSPRSEWWASEDVPVSELLDKNLEAYQGYKAKVDFPELETCIDPYWLGAWLGDGHSNSTRITTADPEMVKTIYEYAEYLGMRVGVYAEAENNASTSYAIVNVVPSRSNPNFLCEQLRDLSVLNNKHIPQIYKSNSREVRLQLLAGLIDSDGHRSLTEGCESRCELVFKVRQLAKDTQWLARSLGFRASLSPRDINGITYYRIFIYGPLWLIPTKIPRKQWEERPLRENPLTYGFKLEELPEDDYYGFTIDGNKRFLLGDCTVTHNTESIADVGVGLAIILPSLHEAFPDDGRFKPFKDGFKLGIYAPIAHQSGIAFARMRKVITSDHGVEIMDDPEIGVYIVVNRSDTIVFSNGSRIMAKSASPDTQIEGDTHDLIVLEEAQKLSRTKVEKEILPMRTATGGSVVKIGTAWHSRGGFHMSIQENVDRYKEGGKRNHFEFPYTIVIEEKRRRYMEEVAELGEQSANPFHLMYEKSVQAEITRLGGTDNDDFKMNYECVWFETRMVAIKMSVLKDSGVKELEARFVRTGIQVAGLDIGKTNDATVLTHMLVYRDKPVRNTVYLPEAEEDKQLYYPKLILGWKEFYGSFEGDDGQYDSLVKCIEQTNISVLCVDATAMGNPVFERIQVLLEPAVVVVPIIFGTVTKHNLYKYYLQELNAKRIKHAAGEQTKKSREYQKFMSEHETLDKVQKGAYIICEAAEGEHDDYPDSAALACWAEKVMDEVAMPEVSVTPYGNQAMSRFPGAQEGQVQVSGSGSRYQRGSGLGNRYGNTGNNAMSRYGSRR